jgi:ArsR family transcriptional regulator
MARAGYLAAPADQRAGGRAASPATAGIERIDVHRSARYASAMAVVPAERAEARVALSTPGVAGADGVAGAVGCCGPVVSPLGEAQAAAYAAVLKALADPHRLRMLALIAAQPAEAPLCACDVESAFDLSQPTISHHLKVLREAGLIGVAKRGLWHYYSLRPGGLGPVREVLGALTPVPASGAASAVTSATALTAPPTTTAAR